MTRVGLRRGQGSSEDLGEYLALDPDVEAWRVETAQQAWAELIGADALARARAVRRPSGELVLPDRRLVRAAVRLTDPEQGPPDDLASAIADAGPTLGAYLLLLSATGRRSATVLALAEHASPHRREPSWLHRHLGMLDASPGPAAYTDDDGAPLRLRQLNEGTNHATVVVSMRVRLDPAYALWLTTGAHLEHDREPDWLPFEQRFRSEQQAVAARIARGGSGLFGRLRGSSTAALAQFVNRFTRLTGAGFAWIDFAALAPQRRPEALAVIAAGVRAGVPVPLAVATDGDRHLVLVLAAAGESLLAFDPAAGAVVALGAATDRLDGALLPQLLEG
ncbi:MAG: hypothetical protein ACT4QF_18795 [Sporichthyaceae bacterium]